MNEYDHLNMDADFKKFFDSEPMNTASLVRHFTYKSKQNEAGFLLKVDQAFLQSMSGLQAEPHLRAALIIHEHVCITLILIKLGGRLFDIAYNFYGTSANHQIVAIDLSNQDTLPIHLVSQVEHSVITIPNHLQGLTKRLLSMSNILPVWSDEDWIYALRTFYICWDDLERFWERLDTNVADNLDYHLIISKRKTDPPDLINRLNPFTIIGRN